MIDRNEIIEALRARLESGLAGEVTVSRGVKEPSPEDMPILQVGALTEQRNEETAGMRPAWWRLRVSSLLWFKTSDEGGPVPQMLTLIDKIEAALVLQEGERGGYWTTLGGFVSFARLDGVDTMPDVKNENQARALIAVDVLTKPER